MNERVLKRLKEYLDFPDGKFTDEHIVKTYEGSELESRMERDIAIEDFGKTIERMLLSWKDKELTNQQVSKTDVIRE